MPTLISNTGRLKDNLVHEKEIYYRQEAHTQCTISPYSEIRLYVQQNRKIVLRIRTGGYLLLPVAGYTDTEMLNQMCRSFVTKKMHLLIGSKNYQDRLVSMRRYICLIIFIPSPAPRLRIYANIMQANFPISPGERMKERRERERENNVSLACDVVHMPQRHAMISVLCICNMK